MPYEYNAFVLAHDAPEGSSDWPDLLDRLIASVQSTMNREREHPWELVSHDFLIAGGEVIATFFVR